MRLVFVSHNNTVNMVLSCPACGPLHTVNSIIIHSGHLPDVASMRLFVGTAVLVASLVKWKV